MTKHDQVFASDPTKGVPLEGSPLGTDEALIIKDGVAKRAAIEDLPVGGGADVYSDTETLTDMTWNGQPVYRKLVDFGALPNSTSKAVAHGITGIDRMIRVHAEVQDAVPLYYSLPYVGSSILSMIAAWAGATFVNVFCGQNRTGFSGRFILEYTKV